MTRLRTVLGAFLFSGDSVDKRVAVLSGGEKARVALARMLLRPAALLALDEPTNHLDLGSREVLEAALAEFPGTIVFISHDRYFINRVATRIVEVDHGRLTSYLGTYDDFLTAKTAAAIPAQKEPGDGTTAAITRAAPARRSTPGLRGLRVRLDEVERRIRELEDRLRALGDLLAAPELYRDGDRVRAAVSERDDAEQEVAALMREWEALSTELAGRE
jgi:ATP-binding cassette subfamily F protein 3